MKTRLFIPLALTLAVCGVTLTTTAQTPQTPQTGQQTPQPPARVRSSQPRPRVDMAPPMPDNSPVKPAVEAARRGDYEQAATLLSALDPATLVPAEARRWRLQATVAAVRTGNLTLLKRANQNRDGIIFADGRQILHAWELAQVERYDLAKATLKKISDPDALDERSHRRYLALLAGIAEQEKDTTTERTHINGLVDYLGAWKSDTCQSCHENPEKYGDDVTTLRVTDHWIGKRFIALMQAAGDVAMVEAQARKRLQEDATDEGARLRLAYALQAQGKPDAAEVEFRKLEWAAFPDRPFKQPDNDIRFPGILPLPVQRPLSEFMPDNHIISASDYLKAADFARCRQELAAVAPYTRLTAKQQLRVWQVERYLAKLEGQKDAEAGAIKQIEQIIQKNPDLRNDEKRFP